MTSTERTGWRANTQPYDGPIPIRAPEEEQALFDDAMTSPDTLLCRATEPDAFDIARRRLRLVGE